MANASLDGMFQRVLGRKQGEGHPFEAVGDFAVVDGARAPEIHRRLVGSLATHACLYDGELPPRLARAAPYVVNLRRSPQFARWYREHGWGRAFGLIVRWSGSLEALRRHLRSLAYVRAYDGCKLLFRYYDPRVARVFLPTCDEEQLRLFFGKIEALLIEGENERVGELYTLEPGAGLVRQPWSPAGDGLRPRAGLAAVGGPRQPHRPGG